MRTPPQYEVSRFLPQFFGLLFGPDDRVVVSRGLPHPKPSHTHADAGQAWFWSRQTAGWVVVGLLAVTVCRSFAGAEIRTLAQEGTTNTMQCTVYPPDNLMAPGPAGMVIHLYGRGGTHKSYNMRRPPYAELRRVLAERGYWLVVPELGPDHWMNDTAVGTVDAVIATMTTAERIDPDRVHILGTSMGGGSGLAYVVQRPNAIRSICALFPMTDFNMWIKEKPGYAASFARGYNVEPRNLEPLLAGRSPMQHTEAFAEVPVFLLHGGADATVPPHHSRDFAAALRARGYAVTHHEVPGFGHSDDVAKEFQEDIADFLTGEVQKK